MLISKDDKIFIAGHSGMVGSAIKRNLTKKGYKYLQFTSRKNLNLLNVSEVKKWFKVNNPDVVILAAAKVGGIYANQAKPKEFLLENLTIQNNIIENAWISGTKRLLFLGSSCIYPKFANQPIDEESLLSGYLEKTNEAYALAKITGIKLCEYLRNQYKFDCISLMPTNLYGPKDNYHKINGHVIPALIQKFSLAKFNNNHSVKCWGDGSPLREFLYVDDLAEACIFALEKWDPESDCSPRKQNGEILTWLNVGHNEEFSIKELAEKISKYSDFKGEINWDNNKPNGTPRKKLDISKLSKLGWTAKIGLDEGLKKTIESYNQEKDEGFLRTS